jgi:hypothetical protein
MNNFKRDEIATALATKLEVHLDDGLVWFPRGTQSQYAARLFWDKVDMLMLYLEAAQALHKATHQSRGADVYACDMARCIEYQTIVKDLRLTS